MRTLLALTFLLLASATPTHAVITAPALASGHVTVGSGTHLTTPGSGIAANTTLTVPGTQLTEITGTSGGSLRLTGGTTLSLGKNASLSRGNALVSTGKGRFLRRSTNLHLGPLGVTLKGTALLAHQPGNSIKITVLEGTATARFDSAKLDFIQLGPGDMLLADPSIEIITPPVTVNLGRLASSSRLLSHARKPLSETAGTALRKNIDRQKRALASGKLLASTVVVGGSGGTATVGNNGSDNNTSSVDPSPSSPDSTSSTSSGSTGNSTSGGSGTIASSGSTALSAASACG